jgi:hypothetical protein
MPVQIGFDVGSLNCRLGLCAVPSLLDFAFRELPFGEFRLRQPPPAEKSPQHDWNRNLGLASQTVEAEIVRAGPARRQAVRARNRPGPDGGSGEAKLVPPN